MKQNQQSRVGIMVILVITVLLFGGVRPIHALRNQATSFTEMATISGTVYDAGVPGGDSHGYPLYASLTFTAGEVSQTIYSDPFDETYQIELDPGQAYTVTVSAVPQGYETYTANFNPATDPHTQDFQLYVDSTTCSAPGYSGGVFIEAFESGELPPGWVNIDYRDPPTGEVWEFLNDPNIENKTPGAGGFAVLDSFIYANELEFQDAGLRTPVIDFSVSQSVTLSFDTDFISYENATANVRVSDDNGNTWTTKFSRTYDVESEHISLDISDVAAGEAQVIVEFRYTGDPDNPWGDWWQVDNVRIESGDCSLVPGGVVAGYVQDAHTGAPLVGADVESLDASAQTFALGGDPDRAGLYWVFQPTTTDPQTVDFTASLDGYTDDVRSVSITRNQITRQDFSLGSGYLNFSPEAFDVSMGSGDDPIDQILTVSNPGTLPVSFELAKVNRSHTDAGLLPAFAIGYPGENLVYLPDAAVPGSWDVVGSVAEHGFYAGDFIGGDFSTLYVVDSFTDMLYTLDTDTGELLEIGLTTPDVGLTGLTGTSGGSLFGISSNCGVSTDLLTVNPTTAETVNLGSLSGITCGIDLAYNALEEMIYIVDRHTNHLFQVNPLTLEVTDVGSLGINSDYAQGLDYEEESGLLYWAAYNATDAQGELRVIDMGTGESTLIGPFPGGENVTVLAFATGGPVDWLGVAPGSGTLDPGGAATVTVTFDPSTLDQPGIYDAALFIKHDSLYTYDPITIQLNLNGEATAITSTNNTNFIVGILGEFTVQATGFPAPVIEHEGDLPVGVTFTDNSDGTATLGGIPQGGSGGIYPLTITASNGFGEDAVQAFTLTVIEAPSITSANTVTWFLNQENTFTFTTWGFPTPAVSYEGNLPAGFEFQDNSDGTAELSGIPVEGQQGQYPLAITASNTSGPDATQDFTLKVIDAIEADFTVFLPLMTR